MRPLFLIIEKANTVLGKACIWLALVMTLLGAMNAILRYLGVFLKQNLISNAYTEAQWYLFSAVFLLAAPYVLQQNRHVRVDVLYGNLSQKRKYIVDLIGTIVFLLPFCLFGVWASLEFVMIVMTKIGKI